MSTKHDTRAAVRLLKRLVSRGFSLFADEKGYRFEHGGFPPRRLDASEVAVTKRLCADGMVTRLKEGRLVLSEAGRCFLIRQLCGDEGFALQHQERSVIALNDPDRSPIRVTVNHSESPLSWLRRRKGPDGQPMVGDHEYAAGERLRSDYERGQLRPRVTANWSAAVAAGRRSGAGGLDLTEAVVAARQRVENALRAVDREFAGPLVDVCCFLKGIEMVERERQWPARSGKLMIKVGLARLARHYGLSPAAEGSDWARLLHWGTDDYRPRIGG